MENLVKITTNGNNTAILTEKAFKNLAFVSSNSELDSEDNTLVFDIVDFENDVLSYCLADEEPFPHFLRTFTKVMSITKWQKMVVNQKLILLNI